MTSPRLGPGRLTALGLIAAVGPVAVDFYLPVLPEIAADLSADPATVQLTLTAFMIGIAAGQLALGPLSDRVGRRPVLVTAMAVFALTSALAWLAPSIWVLIAARAAQGFSGAAGMVLSRAIATDLAHGRQAVRALSLIMMMVGLGPIIAPPLGGALAEITGWRGVFAAMTVLAVAMFALAVITIPESHPPQARAADTAGFLRSFGRLFADPVFVGYLVAFAFGFAAMIAYMAASPFVGQTVLGMDPVVFALGFGASAAAMLLANLVNAMLAPRVGPGRMLAVGQSLAALAAAAFAVQVLTGSLTIVGFIVSAFVLTAGTGFTMSNATALALSRARERGAASAMLGACQFAVAAAVTPLVGIAGEQTAVPMSVVIGICVIVGVGGAGVAVARSPRVSRAV